MKYFKSYPGWKVQFLHNKSIVLSKKNIIKQLDFSLSETSVLCYKVNLIEKILFLSELISKVLRMEIFELKPYRSGFVGFFKGSLIYITDKKQYNYYGFRGNRALKMNFDKHNKNLIFGEYFSNNGKNSTNREDVSIFKFNSNEGLSKVYTFPKNKIRHIHNVIYNDFNDSYIVLTGDYNGESKIIQFNSDFSQKKTIASGSQLFRCIEIICKNDHLIAASDTELAQNKIYKIDYSGKVSNMNHVDGSVFHLKKYPEFYLATTGLEKSRVNQQNYICIYVSLDGQNWKILNKYKKNKIPLFLSKFFRYPTIELIDLNSHSFNYIPIFFRNIENYKDGTYFFEKSEIIKKLNF